jgi:hypothetical protein
VCHKYTSKHRDRLKRHINEVHFSKFIKCPICNTIISERKFKERHYKQCSLKHALQKYVGASQHERKVTQILTEKEINFNCQKKFEDLKSPTSGILLSYDFYLPDKNILIEV